MLSPPKEPTSWLGQAVGVIDEDDAGGQVQAVRRAGDVMATVALRTGGIDLVDRAGRLRQHDIERARRLATVVLDAVDGVGGVLACGVSDIGSRARRIVTSTP